MRNVEAHKGNLTDELWASMGDQLDGNGVERHGQSCYLTVFPNGTPETRAAIEASEWVDSDTLNDDETPSGPIDLVAANVLDMFVQCNNFDTSGSFESVQEYDGYRVGAGWIYAAILVAKAHGCTQAVVQLSSNDGNLHVECWDRKLGAFVYATHHTYYGT